MRRTTVTVLAIGAMEGRRCGWTHTLVRDASRDRDTRGSW
jgi:hypothetical protein